MDSTAPGRSTTGDAHLERLRRTEGQVRGDLGAAAAALRRRTPAVIGGHLFRALADDLVALPLAAAGLLDPVIAGEATAPASVFVVSSSLRLRRLQPLPAQR